MRWALVAIVLAIPARIGAGEPGLQAFSTVRVDVPAQVSFEVSDATPGTIVVAPPSRVAFSQASLPPGQALRISIKAEGSVVLPGGIAIPAANFHWTASQIVNGVGMNGTLNESAFAPVYQSRADARTGRVDLTLSLSVPAGISRAGTGQVNLRWKFESVVP